MQRFTFFRKVVLSARKSRIRSSVFFQKYSVILVWICASVTDVAKFALMNINELKLTIPARASNHIS